MNTPELMEALTEAFAALRQARFPSVRGAVELREAEVDLAEEDAYIAGLVDSFLGTRTITLRSITLSRSIDDRLARAQELTDAQRMQPIVRYRQHLIRVAELLSRASGIPLEWTE
jgi:hypothetical protein